MTAHTTKMGNGSTNRVEFACLRLCSRIAETGTLLEKAQVKAQVNTKLKFIERHV